MGGQIGTDSLDVATPAPMERDSVTAYEDVLDWLVARPWWQQRALARIASGETIGQGEYEEIAKSLFEKALAAPDGGWLA